MATVKLIDGKVVVNNEPMPAKAEVADHALPESTKTTPKEEAKVTYQTMRVDGPGSLSFLVDVKRVKADDAFKLYFVDVSIDGSVMSSSTNALFSKRVLGDEGETIDWTHTQHKSFPVMVFKKTKDGKEKAEVTAKLPSNKVFGEYIEQFTGPLAEHMRMAAELAVKRIQKGEGFPKPDTIRMPKDKTPSELRIEFMEDMSRAYKKFAEKNGLTPAPSMNLYLLDLWLRFHHEEVKEEQ